MIYSGNKLFNAHNGVSLILLFVMPAMLAGGTVPTVGFIIIWTLLLASGAFYFELNTDQLLVKNYMLPFVNIKYNLEAITKIELQGTSYRDTSYARVKIYQNGKSSWGFSAASLKLPDWQNLVTDLTQKKIAVTITAIKLTNQIGLPED